MCEFASLCHFMNSKYEEQLENFLAFLQKGKDSYSVKILFSLTVPATLADLMATSTCVTIRIG